MNSLGDFFATSALSGALIIAIPLAVVAGAVSFLSPCILPLAPGLIGYTTGLTSAGPAPRARRRIALGVSLFILGFSAVFVAYGALFGALGAWLVQWQELLTRVLGGVVVVLGLVMIGAIPILQRTIKPAWKPRIGIAGAPLLGIVFGLGWTPCIGPTLSAVVALSMSEASAVRGALLGLAYCVGLGVPLLGLALGLQSATGAIARLRKHIRLINVLGGLMLIVVGVLMISGIWGQAIRSLQGIIGSFQVIV